MQMESREGTFYSWQSALVRNNDEPFWLLHFIFTESRFDVDIDAFNRKFLTKKELKAVNHLISKKALSKVYKFHKWCCDTFRGSVTNP